MKLRLFPTAFALFALVALSVANGACNRTLTTSEFPPFTQTDLKIGDGATAASGNTLSVNYTGWLFDSSKPDGKGVQFDTTTGRAPFNFTLGTNQVIAGWDQGVPGMKVGGVRRLVIPPSLGYGNLRNGPIPPNATLVFEIELLDVTQ